MKRNFIKGFITGAVVFGSITSFAMMSYQAYQADFNIMLNGQKWECDKPIVTIDGSTYLPLKALGDALGVKVNWNSDLRQVEIGEVASTLPTSVTFSDGTYIVGKDIAPGNYDITGLGDFGLLYIYDEKDNLKFAEMFGADKLPNVINNLSDFELNLGDKITIEDVSISFNETAINKYSRTNPAPIGTKQTVTVSNFLEEYTATVEVKETIRGSKAMSMLKKANEYWNEEPEEGFEYVLAKINVKMGDVKDDKAIDINNYSFDCFSTNNVQYEDFLLVVCPEPQLSTKLYSDGETSGYVVFKVKETDATPKIVFGQNYDGTGGIWFSLAQQ